MQYSSLEIVQHLSAAPESFLHQGSFVKAFWREALQYYLTAKEETCMKTSLLALTESEGPSLL